jgi:protein arginine N-methyltransferase 1
MLYDSGILVGEDAVSAAPAGGFDAPPIHAAMLNDTERVRAYERAIAEVVSSDDIVLDIGTGTGVLAALAARAGARHVYAVEEGRIGEAAQRTFQASPWRDQLTLVRGRSTKLTIPEPATVVVSEILGHDPFDEGVLTVYRDAAHRLTCKGARWIPSRIDLFAELVELPSPILRDDTFCEENLARWSDAYGIPFQTLQQYEDDSPYAINVKAADFVTWRRVSEPVLLVSQDLTAIEHTEIEARASLTASGDCEHVGVVTYFDAVLSPGVTLSTAPSTGHTRNHWKYRVYICGSRKRVARGEEITICYAHGSDPTTISFC